MCDATRRTSDLGAAERMMVSRDDAPPATPTSSLRAGSADRV